MRAHASRLLHWVLVEDVAFDGEAPSYRVVPRFEPLPCFEPRIQMADAPVGLLYWAPSYNHSPLDCYPWTGWKGAFTARFRVRDVPADGWERARLGWSPLNLVATKRADFCYPEASATKNPVPWGNPLYTVPFLRVSDKTFTLCALTKITGETLPEQRMGCGGAQRDG